MKEVTRITIDLPAQVAVVVDRMAAERGLTRAALCRQGLGLLQAMHEGAMEGLYTGLTRDREKLDTVIVGPI
jgi:hypothetical protein